MFFHERDFPNHGGFHPAALPIVLTGTIVPNAIMTTHLDAAERRKEYLQSVLYYCQVGPVYFLENSIYDLENDREFREVDNLVIVKFQPSDQFQRGKGYQEFQMLDRFVSRLESEAFLKITGRYQIRNIQALYRECSASHGCSIMIEQYRRFKLAMTDVFYATTGFYRAKLSNLYLQSDDSSGIFIEHVLRIALSDARDCKLFRTIPIKSGKLGSNGETIEEGLPALAKRVIRSLTYPLDTKYRIF